jgi:uncharacterized NAD-dependent epimerase/dehydratase family protein
LLPAPTTVSSSERFLVLAEGLLGPHSSKTASACIRYTPERVVAVIDSTKAGHTVQEYLGFGGDIPVVATLQEGLAHQPNAVLIGIAPAGGQLPADWREMLVTSLERGLDVWSGLHYFLADDAELAAAAARGGARIFDLRRPPADLDVSMGRTRDLDATVVLTVGTDCNIGKMTAQLQLRESLKQRGNRVAFAATGQTGILIEGWGISVDAVVADFIGGAAERLTLQAAQDADIVLVEGQGSIIHPSFSGVTYGLIHGTLPHAFVLCAQPSRKAIRRNEWVPIPPLDEMVRMHDDAVRHLRPAPTIAVALNTSDLSEADALAAIREAESLTGLPATDPVRYDPAPIAEAIEAFHRSRAGVAV